MLQLHRDYLDAGADVITAVSYQASLAAFQRELLVDGQEALRLMRLTVELAVQARDDWWRDNGHHQRRQRPLVAASIGCYGACMGGGQEYTGDYSTHRSRKWRDSRGSGYRKERGRQTASA